MKYLISVVSALTIATPLLAAAPAAPPEAVSAPSWTFASSEEVLAQIHAELERKLGGSGKTQPGDQDF